jgi:hypothetical protein
MGSKADVSPTSAWLLNAAPSQIARKRDAAYGRRNGRPAAKAFDRYGAEYGRGAAGDIIEIPTDCGTYRKAGDKTVDYWIALHAARLG